MLLRVVSFCFLVSVLGGCGGEGFFDDHRIYSVRFSVDGPQTIAANRCTAYTVSRYSPKGQPVAVPSPVPLQPGLRSGKGGVYADPACTASALLNLSFATGKSSAVFYFMSAQAGETVLEAGDVMAPTDELGTLSVLVQE